MVAQSHASLRIIKGQTAGIIRMLPAIDQVRERQSVSLVFKAYGRSLEMCTAECQE